MIVKILLNALLIVTAFFMSSPECFKRNETLLKLAGITLASGFVVFKGINEEETDQLDQAKVTYDI